MEPAAPARAEINDRLWRCYPSAVHPIDILKIVSSGLSGGVVWKVRTASGDVAVRKHGPQSLATQIAAIHAAMTQARRFEWNEVSQPMPNLDGETTTVIEGTCWDLCTWQPGEVAALPIDDARLRSAMHLIGRWHSFWTAENARSIARSVGRTSVKRRQSEWRRLLVFDMPALTHGHATPELNSLSRRTRTTIQALRRRIESDLQTLETLLDGEPLVFCHGDLHREHILFTNDEPTGLIDLSCRWDYAAADLARWLSSVAEANRWPEAVEWYREKAPLSAESKRAISILAETGAAIAAMRWERWLLSDHESERRFFPRRDLAVLRWRHVVERLERLEL